MEKLAAVELAESYLAELGLSDFRVRHHGDVARLEVRPEDWPVLMAPGVRETLTRKLKALGFRFVSLDLDGLRPGSLSLELKGA